MADSCFIGRASALPAPPAETPLFIPDSDMPEQCIERALINIINQPNVTSHLKWVAYLNRLSEGAWGDHIVLQTISNIFQIAINVYDTINKTETVVHPMKGSVIQQVNVGLILEKHYVGLDATDAVEELNADECVEIDGQPIEEGDEHTRNITGGPQSCTMMMCEEDEAESRTYSVAPAEGEKPINIMTDPTFEVMCNPDKFPFGYGGFNTERPRKITYKKYFQQRLLDVDGRFSKDLDYLFTAQYITEAKQVFDNASHFAWRQKPSQHMTVAQAKSEFLVQETIRKDKAYAFLKNVRGSPPYYQRTFYELLAMIRQLGTPTWFFTLSAADMKWPEVIQIIARQYGVSYTDEEVAALSYEERSKWLRTNPVTAARHFQYRLDMFFKVVLKSTAHPLGKITDHAIRIEFQNRGSPHAHCVLWIKDAPRIGIASDDEVCDFIDKYISCSIPNDDDKLKELVTSVQQHRHNTYCKRNKKCRFNFPHPPTSHTLIAQSDQVDDEAKSLASNVLGKVRKLLIDKVTNVTLEELLEMAEVDQTVYEEALHIAKKGKKIILKRAPPECNINNYNPAVLRAWQANMDIQYVMDAYACVMYVASYIMKHEKSMGEVLKAVSNEVRTEELSAQLRRVGMAFLTHREVSAQEAVYRILSLPMKSLSRSVIFLDTNPKAQRIAVLKDTRKLNELDDEDTDVFQKSLIDRYEHRPNTLRSLCFADFAATYAVDYYKKDDDAEHGDALPPSEDSDRLGARIRLTSNFGTMRERRQKAVVRFTRYNRDSDSSNWYRAKLMLYYPWYNEEVDLLGGFNTYMEHYRNVQSVVVANEQKYTKADIEDIDFNSIDHPEHAWEQLAPTTEERRLRANEEGQEELTNVSERDLQDNMRVSGNNSAQVRYESAINKEIIPPAQYNKMIRQLNVKQREMVMYHRQWCKSALIALRNNEPVKPYRVFLSGPGGVGKSHVIKIIQSDTIRLLKLSGVFEPDEVIVLLTAPTGVAAFNIEGMTLHSALFLNSSRFNSYQPLGSERLNTLRVKLSKLALLIIDEVSMVGANMLLEIHKRLQQIKGLSSANLFGDVSILAVGDLYQLPPVGQPAVFDIMSDRYAKLFASGSLWREEFKMVELTEVMRQREDRSFVDILNRVRKCECTDVDKTTLESRVIDPDSPDYPFDALHVYRLNVDVDNRNSIMLDKITTECHVIKSCDSVGSQTTHINLSTLSTKRSETGGLHGELKIAVSARVMLTTNVNVSDGLVNGARGEVVHIVANNNNEVSKILVKFDNPSVGRAAITGSAYKSSFPDAVPIIKCEATFSSQGKRGAEIIRLQFPLTLAWATTIHKVQGLTLEKIVVDMRGGNRFSPGQAYVAFSRVRRLQDLFILNFNSKAIKQNLKVANEMSRLENSVIPSTPLLRFHDLTDTHVTLMLLNVRCLLSKLPDLLLDSNVQNADILCFCESWLSPSITSISPIKSNHVITRCDRVSPNNKGGVVASISSQFNPTSPLQYHGIGIEALSTTLTFSNDRLNVIVIYRSSKTPLSNLISMLTQILQCNETSHYPTLVMGDFNVNFSMDTPLFSLMCSYGFKQLVTKPTTDRGSLIDHVYYNGCVNNVIIDSTDIYYSDHDAIFVSLPFKS